MDKGMTKILLPLILVTALLVGCSRSPEGPEKIEEGERAPPALIQPPPANNGNGSLTLTPAEDPISIKVELDPTRAEEAVITPDGGVIRAAGGDGTRYILDIPAGALRETVKVRMTPAARISGLPFGESTAYGVHLEPEGLFFYNFAVLTIEPPETLLAENQITFGYRENGSELYLAAPVVQSTEIQIQLLHFSGYGVTMGLLSDLEPVRGRLGGSAETRLQTVVAELLMIERQRWILGSSDTSERAGEEVDELVQEYYQQVIQPRAAAAGESCAAGRLALETLILYERQRQLLGAGTSDDQGDDLITKDELFDIVGPTCLKEEFEMCRDLHVIHRIIPTWLSLEREAQILGTGSSEGETPLTALARQYAVQCLRFELEFESEGRMGPGSTVLISSVNTRVPLQLDEDMVISGQAPLVNSSFSASMDGCTFTPKTGDGTFIVFGLSFETFMSGAKDDIGEIRDLILLYFPGSTHESYSFTCGSDDMVYQSSEGPIWSFIYKVNHVEENKSAVHSPVPRASNQPQLPETISAASFSTSTIYETTGWTIIGGELFAELEWRNISSISENVRESGSFKLYHRP
jgi:hypothetical protein